MKMTQPENVEKMLEEKCEAISERLKYYLKMEKNRQILLLGFLLAMLLALAADVKITIIVHQIGIFSFVLGLPIIASLAILFSIGIYREIAFRRKLKKYGYPLPEDFVFFHAYNAYKCVKNLIKYELNSFLDDAISQLKEASESINRYWSIGNLSIIWYDVGEKVDRIITSINERLIPALKEKRKLEVVRDFLRDFTLLLAKADSANELSLQLDLLNRLNEYVELLPPKARAPFRIRLSLIHI